MEHKKEMCRHALLPCFVLFSICVLQFRFRLHTFNLSVLKSIFPCFSVFLVSTFTQ